MSTTSKPVADEQVRLDMYRMMQEARLFEKRAQDLFLEGLIKGTSHLALGQEAVAAGSPRRCGPRTSSTAPIAATSTRCCAARRWAR